MCVCATGQREGSQDGADGTLTAVSWLSVAAGRAALGAVSAVTAAAAPVAALRASLFVWWRDEEREREREG